MRLLLPSLSLSLFSLPRNVLFFYPLDYFVLVSYCFSFSSLFLGAVRAVRARAMLAVGCDDGRVRLLDPRLRSGSVEHVLKAHTGPVQALAVTPTDGVKVRPPVPCPLGFQQTPAHPENPTNVSVLASCHGEEPCRVFPLV